MPPILFINLMFDCSWNGVLTIIIITDTTNIRIDCSKSRWSRKIDWIVPSSCRKNRPPKPTWPLAPWLSRCEWHGGLRGARGYNVRWELIDSLVWVSGWVINWWRNQEDSPMWPNSGISTFNKSDPQNTVELAYSLQHGHVTMTCLLINPHFENSLFLEFHFISKVVSNCFSDSDEISSSLLHFK